MLKNVGVVLAICALLFGWLRTHDHYVRADALAKARHDSLSVVSKQVDLFKDSINTIQNQLHKKADSIGKETVKVYKQKTTVDAKAKFDESEYEAWKAKVVTNIKDSLVVAFVEKSDDYIRTMKAQVIIATRLEQLARDSTRIMTDLYFGEVKKREAIEGLNVGLKKELATSNNGMSVGRAIIHYIIPVAGLTYGITKLTERRNSKTTSGPSSGGAANSCFEGKAVCYTDTER